MLGPLHPGGLHVFFPFGASPMLITVGCPQCQRRYDVAGRLAGKRVRCKDCATVFRVPVPTTMPEEAPRKKRRKERRVSLDDGPISDLLDVVGSVEADAFPSATRAQSAAQTDPGERLGYRIAQVLTFAVIVGFALLGWWSLIRATVMACFVAGGFLLAPILLGWESFAKTRRARWLGSVLGPDGARAAQATAAIALWVFAVLLAMDTIHIRVLDPTPAPTVPASDAPKPTEDEPKE